MAIILLVVFYWLCFVSLIRSIRQYSNVHVGTYCSHNLVKHRKNRLSGLKLIFSSIIFFSLIIFVLFCFFPIALSCVFLFRSYGLLKTHNMKKIQGLFLTCWKHLVCAFPMLFIWIKDMQYVRLLENNVIECCFQYVAQ